MTSYTSVFRKNGHNKTAFVRKLHTRNTNTPVEIKASMWLECNAQKIMIKQINLIKTSLIQQRSRLNTTT